MLNRKVPIPFLSGGKVVSSIEWMYYRTAVRKLRCDLNQTRSKTCWRSGIALLHGTITPCLQAIVLGWHPFPWKTPSNHSRRCNRRPNRKYSLLGTLMGKIKAGPTSGVTLRHDSIPLTTEKGLIIIDYALNYILLDREM